MERQNPVRPADDDARAIARAILRKSRIAALGVIHPDTGAPCLSRIAFGLSGDGTGLSLVSDLALHSRALRQDPRASLLLGEAGERGDPLNHPRLSLQVTSRFVAPDEARRLDLRAAWLKWHPKSKLYVDFADFHFVAFDIDAANLNAGFAKAYALGPNDLKIG
ncbi:MAG: pyridoxamine 5-phosphate oxidase [Rhodobacteraceae bacterium]|nr:pyridoxamine 5-phosphate oxidase [Paracoccaceae bacterium]